MARLLFVVAAVSLGFSIPGVILASIGASVVELAVAWHYTRPPLFGATGSSARQLRDAALPLFLSAMALRAFDKLDLFLLKTFGATAGQAGLYGVAQNLTIVTALFAGSFAPLLLGTLTRLLRDGDEPHARDIGRDSLRLMIALLPFAGMTAGVAGEIVRAIAGPAFAQTAAPLAVLIFGGLAMTFVAVATAILTAVGKAQWTFVITGPLLPLAAVGHLLVIPRYGAIGAATVTTGVAWMGAIASAGAVYRLWRVTPPVLSILRSIALCMAAYAVAAHWPADGLMLLVKLPAICGLVATGYWALGEVSTRELALLRSLLPGSV